MAWTMAPDGPDPSAMPVVELLHGTAGDGHAVVAVDADAGGQAGAVDDVVVEVDGDAARSDDDAVATAVE